MKRILPVVFLMGASVAAANMLPPPPPKLVVEMHLIDAKGAKAAIGIVTITPNPMGLTLTPNLKGLPPGSRGFHIHENGDCGPGDKDGVMAAGMAAGGHFDPEKTGKHKGPGSTGHKGDLPVLLVAADGTAKTPVSVNWLLMQEVSGRSIVIHAGGDNFSDTPAPLGGGGARIACGVIPVK